MVDRREPTQPDLETLYLTNLAQPSTSVKFRRATQWLNAEVDKRQDNGFTRDIIASGLQTLLEQQSGNNPFNGDLLGFIGTVFGKISTKEVKAQTPEIFTPPVQAQMERILRLAKQGIDIGIRNQDTSASTLATIVRQVETMKANIPPDWKQDVDDVLAKQGIQNMETTRAQAFALLRTEPLFSLNAGDYLSSAFADADFASFQSPLSPAQRQQIATITHSYDSLNTRAQTASPEALEIIKRVRQLTSIVLFKPVLKSDLQDNLSHAIYAWQESLTQFFSGLDPVDESLDIRIPVENWPDITQFITGHILNAGVGIHVGRPNSPFAQPVIDLFDTLHFPGSSHFGGLDSLTRSFLERIVLSNLRPYLPPEEELTFRLTAEQLIRTTQRGLYARTYAALAPELQNPEHAELRNSMLYNQESHKAEAQKIWDSLKQEEADYVPGSDTLITIPIPQEASIYHLGLRNYSTQVLPDSPFAMAIRFDFAGQFTIFGELNQDGQLGLDLPPTLPPEARETLITMQPFLNLFANATTHDIFVRASETEEKPTSPKEAESNAPREGAKGQPDVNQSPGPTREHVRVLPRRVHQYTLDDLSKGARQTHHARASAYAVDAYTRSLPFARDFIQASLLLDVLLQETTNWHLGLDPLYVLDKISQFPPVLESLQERIHHASPDKLDPMKRPPLLRQRPPITNIFTGEQVTVGTWVKDYKVNAPEGAITRKSSIPSAIALIDEALQAHSDTEAS